jgi:hypothetical protein
MLPQGLLSQRNLIRARSSRTGLTSIPGLGSMDIRRGEARMRTFVRDLVAIVMMAVASMAFVTIAMPAVSSADCAAGEWWDPTGKVCRPLGVGPQPLACEQGQWWDPTANICRPLGVGPQPLACDNGWWWDPGANVCRPPVVPPAG